MSGQPADHATAADHNCRPTRSDWCEDALGGCLDPVTEACERLCASKPSGCPRPHAPIQGCLELAGVCRYPAIPHDVDKSEVIELVPALVDDDVARPPSGRADRTCGAVLPSHRPGNEVGGHEPARGP